MSTPEIVKGKRGRKSKKELMASLGMIETALIKDQTIEPTLSKESNATELKNTVLSSILEPLEKHISLSVSEIISEPNNENIDKHDMDNANDNLEDEDEPVVKSGKQALKKRGRKPKGGKIIQQSMIVDSPKNDKPNVILHLKCSMKDLNNSSGNGNGNGNLDNGVVESFTFNKNNNLCYDVIGSENINSVTSNDKSKNTKNTMNILNSMNSLNDKCINDDNEYDYEDSNNNNIKETTTKELWKKLKQLEHNLHINNVNNKKSACFWDTCEFDNPPVYIPKHYINGTYHVYGCFCSPECGVAYLMNENIDSSTKFERYHLFNHIYSKMYDYKKNIKPAPNPYYMLEKYYGNLTIQEYRSLLRNERLFLIVDKPLTRILPELHDDNDDFILNNKIIPSNNNYQLKSRMQRKKPSKNSILNEKFGGTSTAGVTETTEYE
jgi:hypothetical protein